MGRKVIDTNLGQVSIHGNLSQPVATHYYKTTEVEIQNGKIVTKIPDANEPDILLFKDWKVIDEDRKAQYISRIWIYDSEDGWLPL